MKCFASEKQEQHWVNTVKKSYKIYITYNVQWQQQYRVGIIEEGIVSIQKPTQLSQAKESKNHFLLKELNRRTFIAKSTHSRYKGIFLYSMVQI